ncbi:MAG: recombinase family protein, partial [Pseudomonadota bacterium]
MTQQRRACIYARYSTDQQSEASVDDQFRVCERLAKQHDFIVKARFSDAAISGGTSKRPGYQQMLGAARRREFDVIVAEDTSRLWRLLAEQAPRLAELADLGVFVVTHDLDTRMESAAVLGAVTGAFDEQSPFDTVRSSRR